MSKQNKKTQNKFWIVLLIVLIVVVGLIIFVLKQSSSEIAQEVSLTQSLPHQPQMIDSHLINQVWYWETTIMGDSSEYTPSNQDDFTLNFNDNGDLKITTDCNHGSASYVVQDNGQISITNLTRTEMACTDSLENIFYSQLEDVNYYLLRDNKLYLNLPLDSGSMVFVLP